MDDHVHDDEDLVILTDEDGEEHAFELVEVISVEGKSYAILAPEGEEEAEAVVLRIESDDDGEDILVDIDDDDEWERVAEAWQELQEDDWDEEDWDDEADEGKGAKKPR